MTPTEEVQDETTVLAPGAEDSSIEVENDESVTVIVNNTDLGDMDDDSDTEARLTKLEAAMFDMAEKFGEVKGLLEGIAAAAEAVAEEPESMVEEAPNETVIEDETPSTPEGESEEFGVGLAGERHAGIWI